MSQFFTAILMPLSLFFLMVLASKLLHKSKHIRVALYVKISAFVFLYLATSPVVMNIMVDVTEKSYREQPMPEYREYAAIMLLGGATTEIERDGERVTQAISAIDRVFVAADLYKKGYSDVIILSGGTHDPETQTPEAMRLAEILTQNFGIKEEALLLESKSLNTFENAKFTRDLLEELSIEGEILLVTSATHMKRAEWMIRVCGIEAEPVAANFSIISSSALAFPEFLIPSATALHYTSGAVKEWLGRQYYKMVKRNC